MRRLSTVKALKPRHFLIGWLAFEIATITAALPATASIVGSWEFGAKPHVVVAEIPNGTPGLSRFLVTSNAGFTISASEMIGEIEVNVAQDGNINGKVFGAKSQLPGPLSHCAQIVSQSGDAIYSAFRATSDETAHAVDQAVVFVFRYAPDASPRFHFAPGETDRLITPCDDRLG